MEELLSDFISVLILSVFYAAAKLVKQFRDKRKKDRRINPLEETLEIDAKVYPLLWRILIDFEAIRVLVIQFHNGERFYSGQSIQKYTASHEVYRTGIHEIKSNIINVPLTECIHNLIVTLRTKGMEFVSTDDENISHSTLVTMKAYGIKSFYAMPIYDTKGNILGFIVLNFNFNNELDEIAHRRLLDYKIKLENALITKHRS